MRVMIQLRQDAAAEVHRIIGGDVPAMPTPDTQRLLNAAATLGVALEPVHPGQKHPLLASHFMGEVPDRKTAEQLIESLQQIPVVEAAYLGPDAQLP